jgi:hypothetical protein
MSISGRIPKIPPISIRSPKGNSVSIPIAIRISMVTPADNMPKAMWVLLFMK